MTTVAVVLDCLRTHLAEFELPPLSSVHVTKYEPNVTAQLACHTPAQIASALLAWADTITTITTEVWRVPRGDTVHLSVLGSSPTVLGSRSMAWCPSPSTESVQISHRTPAPPCRWGCCVSGPPWGR